MEHEGHPMRDRVASPLRAVAPIALALAFLGGPAATAEPDPLAILQAMSDRLAATEAFAFDFDATLDIVTTEDEKIGLAASGTVSVARPDRVRATRTGGFVDLEMVFDGETFTLFGREAGLYASIPAPGSVDALIDTLREEYGVPLPAADLLSADVFAALTEEPVTDAKDLGAGVIRGVVCDHLAFRNAEVDWQIWIAQGEEPYPCRLTITARDVAQAPQYTVDVRDWRVGDAAAADFSFSPSTGARELDLDAFRAAVPDLPPHFSTGDGQ
jgi:hypothetical protein